MGIFKASNETTTIYYYLKKNRTIFIEKEGQEVMTFQVLNKATAKSELDASSWDFEPISNVEFEKVLEEVKRYISSAEVTSHFEEKRILDHTDILGL